MYTAINMQNWQFIAGMNSALNLNARKSLCHLSQDVLDKYVNILVFNNKKTMSNWKWLREYKVCKIQWKHIENYLF